MCFGVRIVVVQFVGRGFVVPSSAAVISVMGVRELMREREREVRMTDGAPVHLVSELSESLVVRLDLLGDARNRLLPELVRSLLLLIPFLTTLLPLVLQLRDQLLVLPSREGSEITETAEVTARLETLVLQSSRDDLLLHLVVRERDTLEDLQLPESLSTPRSLVRKHPTHDTPEDPRRGLVMDVALLRVRGVALAHEGLPFHCSFRE